MSVCLSLSLFMLISLHMSVCLSLFIFVSLLTCLSLLMSISTSSHFYLFLCSSLFLSLFSFTTLCCSFLLLSSLSLSSKLSPFSLQSSLLSLFKALSALSAKLSFLNSLTMFTRSVGSPSLSARKSLTCPEMKSQSAPALARSLNGECSYHAERICASVLWLWLWLL